MQGTGPSADLPLTKIRTVQDCASSRAYHFSNVKCYVIFPQLQRFCKGNYIFEYITKSIKNRIT